ncbi:MAG TPA: NAD(P)H-dependent oxidoreductase subunit E [Deltaproteobacteria bacterium]|nr:NAD(P)H-dependent oxidoreductase subunit E [Deltaproteobacteria bacterium]
MAVDTKEITRIIAGYEKSEESLLAILQDFQKKFNYVPEEGMEKLSEMFGVPASKIYAMGTFYKALSLVPTGRHTCKVCTGTACHLKGAPSLVDVLGRELGIAPGETTEDKRITLQTVNCVGACALAPVVVVDDEDYYEKSSSQNILKNLKKYK